MALGQCLPVHPHHPMHLPRRAVVPPACWKRSQCPQRDSGCCTCNSPLQMIRGLGACVPPQTTVQGCATKTLFLHREQPRWTPPGTEQTLPQPLALHLCSLARSAGEVRQVLNPFPHQCKARSLIRLSRCRRQTQQGEKIPSETFVTCRGLLGVKQHQSCDGVVGQPLSCRCTPRSKPGVRRHHLLVTHLLSTT